MPLPYTDIHLKGLCYSVIIECLLDLLEAKKIVMGLRSWPGKEGGFSHLVCRGDSKEQEKKMTSHSHFLHLRNLSQQRDLFTAPMHKGRLPARGQR